MAKINISVCYGEFEKQVELPCSVEEGCAAKEAVEQSGVLQQFPAIMEEALVLGVFSKKVSLDYVMQPGDRLEIYRPLEIDPKAARLLRAQRAKQKKAASDK